MQIENNRVVIFHYKLREKDGDQLESSYDTDPIAYLHGHQGILEAIQEGLVGKSPDDTITLDVPPERAYGLRRENAEIRVPMKHVDDGTARNFRKGQVVTVNAREGNRTAVVKKVGKFNLDVDVNHPLAGKHLIFEISIVDVREATEEELAHGHAHGPGGHQH